MINIKPCEKCKSNRWKTVKKHFSWQCRKCGYVRKSNETVTDVEIIYESKCNFEFEKVDVFLRVKGRLPNEEGDKLTQDILDEYCDRFEKGELTKGMVPLDYMYNLIKTGEIRPTSQ